MASISWQKMEVEVRQISLSLRCACLGDFVSALRTRSTENSSLRNARRLFNMKSSMEKQPEVLREEKMTSSSVDMLSSHRSSPTLNVASLSYFYSSFLVPATALWNDCPTFLEWSSVWRKQRYAVTELPYSIVKWSCWKLPTHPWRLCWYVSWSKFIRSGTVGMCLRW